MKKIILLTIAMLTIENSFSINCYNQDDPDTYINGKQISLSWGEIGELEAYTKKDDLGGRSLFRALIKLDNYEVESVFLMYDPNDAGEMSSAKAVYATLMSAYARGDYVQINYTYLCVAFNNTSETMKMISSVVLSKTRPLPLGQ